VGGYNDWITQGGALEVLVEPGALAAGGRGAADSGKGDAARLVTPRLSGKDRRELERLERRIAQLESEQRTLHAQMEAPDFWSGPQETIDGAQARLAALAPELEQVYERWTELQN